MQKSVFVAISVTFLLAACATGSRINSDGRSAFIGSLVTHPNPKAPNVFVDDDDYVIVDQEPIRIKLRQGQNPFIVWALENNTPYVFASNPITITPIGTSPSLNNLQCPLSGGAGQKYLVCTYDDPTVKGKYSYTLRVTNSQTGKTLTSDPSIMNQ